MKSINFEEATIKIAEHQEEFNTVFAQRNEREGSVNICFELTLEELRKIQETGKIWYKQITYNNNMRPMRISPFKHEIVYGSNTN
ncbi:MAG: hypothetical protein ABFS35_24120 [Bacteroidota bacterium]